MHPPSPQGICRLQRTPPLKIVVAGRTGSRNLVEDETRPNPQWNARKTPAEEKGAGGWVKSPSRLVRKENEKRLSKPEKNLKIADEFPTHIQSMYCDIYVCVVFI